MATKKRKLSAKMKARIAKGLPPVEPRKRVFGRYRPGTEDSHILAMAAFSLGVGRMFR